MSAMLHGCLQDTDYFEVEAKSGLRYAVWVTTPPGYADSDEPMPLIYVTDGNWLLGMTAPLIVIQRDPYLTIKPYIQVTVGYAGEEAEHWTRLRNRDLVPPGEPVSEEVVAALETAREMGAMTPEQIDAYVDELRSTHADAFLDFLTDELHPQLRTQYRVSETGHGLFGYSYGGIFALYAWLRGSLFSSVGAGSPGVATPDSTIFDLIESSASTDAQLHVTLNEQEVFGAIPVYRALSRYVLSALERLHARGMTDNVTRAMLHGTHITGVQESFLSYLRTCHAQ